MKRPLSRRTRVLLPVGTTAVVVLVLLVLGAAGTTTRRPIPISASVLSPQVARSMGFTETLQRVKTEAVTAEKGCSSSTEAIYGSATTETGLISDVLTCQSDAAAAAALQSARKQSTVDSSITVPKVLRSSAFGSSNPPEFSIVWQAGPRVAVTTFDVAVTKASGSTSLYPLSSTQSHTLVVAALEQNSLYQSTRNG